MIRPREIRNFPSVKDYTERQLSPNDEFFYGPYLGTNQTMIILDLLDRLNPKRCLEWGAGFSTVFFSNLTLNSRWISIEHNEFFCDAIYEFLPSNVRLYCEPIHDDYVSMAAEFAKEGKFDFVFVDGERRPECIELAPSIMNNGGIIIMHDAPPENIPIIVNGVDVRENFKENGLCNGLWWARK